MRLQNCPQSISEMEPRKTSIQDPEDAMGTLLGTEPGIAVWYGSLIRRDSNPLRRDFGHPPDVWIFYTHIYIYFFLPFPASPEEPGRFKFMYGFSCTELIDGYGRKVKFEGMSATPRALLRFANNFDPMSFRYFVWNCPPKVNGFRSQQSIFLYVNKNIWVLFLLHIYFNT